MKAEFCKKKSSSFGYKNDAGLETKDSSLVVMECKKIVNMSKNWIHNSLQTLQSLREIFYLSLSYQTLFLGSWTKTSGLQRHLQILLYAGVVRLKMIRNQRYF